MSAAKQGIVFDSKRLKQLRIKYELAAQEGEDSFLFEGEEYVTDYAKHLITFLEIKLENT